MEKPKDQYPSESGFNIAARVLKPDGKFVVTTEDMRSHFKTQ